MFSPETIVADLRRWMAGTALPFWANAGFNAAQGSFHEATHLDGAPDLAASLRVRVQARQIYVYAHAAELGWYRGGLDAALRSFDFLQEAARGGGPGYVHLLMPDGRVENDLRDTYDSAFLLLAFCWLGRVTGQARVLAAVEDLLGFIDSSLTAPDGSLREGVPAGLPRRQNPHMHMYEALLALHETLGDRRALPRAALILDLMKTRFIDARTGTLGEFFADDWSRFPGPAGDSIEPGHQAEWVWLLARHKRLASEAGHPVEIGDLPARLLAGARAGAAPGQVFLVDEADRLHQIRKATRRLWPQTEMAKALIAQAEMGVPGAADEARRFLRRFAEGYLARPIAAGWMDQFDAHGEPVARRIPASSLYHIFVALAEAERVLGMEA